VAQLISRNPAIRYGFGVFCAILALSVRYLATPVLRDLAPYVPLLFGVVVSAWYAGLGPALLNIALTIMGADYLLIPPYRSFAMASPAPAYSMVFYAMFAVTLVQIRF
jgi:K+-sensing histidine kinase KdpD